MRQMLLLPVVLAVASCGAVSFDVSQSLPEQRVAGNPLGGVLPSFIPTPIPLHIDLQAETQKHGTGPASHVYLTSLTLSATPHDSPSGNFDFLDEVHVFVSSTDGKLPKQEIAQLKPVPKGQTTILLSPTGGVDLLPYINAGAQIEAQATGTQPRMDFTFDGEAIFQIRI